MARLDVQTNVRLPKELKCWLLERAGGNRRSLTSEIVMRLDDSRKAEADAQKATAQGAGHTESRL